MTAAAYSPHRTCSRRSTARAVSPARRVVVPASRRCGAPPAAAAIAHKTDAELLVLCSRNAEPVAVARLMAEEHVARSPRRPH